MCATRALSAIALSCLVLLFRIHTEEEKTPRWSLLLLELSRVVLSETWDYIHFEDCLLYGCYNIMLLKSTHKTGSENGGRPGREQHTHKMGICDISEAAAKQRWNNLWENISFWLLPFPPLLSCVVKICCFLQFSLLFMFGPKMKLFSLLIRENLLSSKFAS